MISEGKLALFDVESGEVHRELAVGEHFPVPAFDGGRIQVAVVEKGQTALYELEGGRRRCHSPGCRSPPPRTGWSPPTRTGPSG